MNREIKFRVWDKIVKTWLDFNPLCHFFNDETLVFSQYSGLKDKNGREIYEGDVAFINTGEAELHGDYIVEYVPGFYHLKPLKGVDWKLALSAHSNKTEIVGNIYESRR